MNIELSRRGFLSGLGAALITAPAIVRAASLMPVKVLENEIGFRSMFEDIPGAYWTTPQQITSLVMDAQRVKRIYPGDSAFFAAMQRVRREVMS